VCVECHCLNALCFLCSADPPDMEMYYEAADGVWRCRRGTSQGESYHSKYHHLFLANHYSPHVFTLKRLAFNHNWNTRAGIANNGDKDWGTADVCELEKIQAICLANGMPNPVPHLKPVKRLTAEEKHRLHISKLPLEAAATLGADIPASCYASAPAHPRIEDDESEFCESHLGLMIPVHEQLCLLQYLVFFMKSAQNEKTISFLSCYCVLDFHLIDNSGDCCSIWLFCMKSALKKKTARFFSFTVYLTFILLTSMLARSPSLLHAAR
jgi:hypothetical protein